MAVIETVPGPGRPGPLRRLVGWWGDRPWLQLAIVAAVVALALRLRLTVAALALLPVAAMVFAAAAMLAAVLARRGRSRCRFSRRGGLVGRRFLARAPTRAFTQEGPRRRLAPGPLCSALSYA